MSQTQDFLPITYSKKCIAAKIFLTNRSIVCHIYVQAALVATHQETVEASQEQRQVLPLHIFNSIIFNIYFFCINRIIYLSCEPQRSKLEEGHSQFFFYLTGVQDSLDKTLIS